MSDGSGFMMEIHRKLFKRESLPDIMKEFENISNYETRVEFFVGILEKHPDILPRVRPSAKTIEASLKYRKEGNSFYAKKDVVKAMEFYNMALLHAPPDSEELSYCYGNRSAALFRINNYGDCLKDISRALEFCTDRSLEKKLLERRTACEKIYEPIGRDEVRERIRRRIFGLPSRINPLVPCFSANIQISRSPKYGRHILAAADIHPGDVLVMEDAKMIFPYAEHYQRICYACYKKNDAMIPCRSCNYVMFCDEECRLKSWNGIHKVECCIVHFLADNNFKIFGRIFQAVISVRCGHRSWKDFMSAVKKEEEKRTNTDDPNVPFPFSLETNERKLDLEEIFLRSLHSAVLLHYLEKYTWFFSEFSKTTDLIDSIHVDPLIRKKYILFTGGILLRYCLNFCNLFSITSYNTVNHDTWAGAFYPFSYYFNHSCAPNAFWTFDGTTMVIKAVRPIKKGHQIFISYKYTYSDDSYEMRQELLQDVYQFKCECEACTNRWPMISDQQINAVVKPILSMIFMSNSPNEENLTNVLDYMYKQALALEEFAPNFDFEVNQKCIIKFWNMFRNKEYL